MTAVPNAVRPLLEQLGGDIFVLHEVINVFLNDAPRMVDAIEECVSRRDATGAYRAAHLLKGSSANFDAPLVTELARAIETGAGEGRLDDASLLLPGLAAAVQQLLSDLRTARRAPCV